MTIFNFFKSHLKNKQQPNWTSSEFVCDQVVNNFVLLVAPVGPSFILSHIENDEHILNVFLTYSFSDGYLKKLPFEILNVEYILIATLDEFIIVKNNNKYEFIDTLSDSSFNKMWKKLTFYTPYERISLTVFKNHLLFVDQILTFTTFLGQGSDGVVFLYKGFVFKMGAKTNKTIFREFNILNNLQDLNFIPQVFSFNINKYFAYFVMEYIQPIKNFSQKHNMINTIGERYKNILKKRGIVNEDLQNEENIILTKKNGKFQLFFIDFGRAFNCFDRQYNLTQMDEKFCDLLQRPHSAKN